MTDDKPEVGREAKRLLEETAYNFERYREAVRAMLEAKEAAERKLARYMDAETWTGCGTGDCPHETAQECADALTRALAVELAENAELRAKLEQAERERSAVVNAKFGDWLLDWFGENPPAHPDGVHTFAQIADCSNMLDRRFRYGLEKARNAD